MQILTPQVVIPKEDYGDGCGRKLGELWTLGRVGS